MGGEFAAWNAKERGKTDLDVEKHIDDFNSELAKQGQGPIGLIPAVPMKVSRGDYDGFGVCFPVGWLHGSFSNHKVENSSERKGSRITITLPVTMAGSTQVSDPRIPDRLRKMAVLSSGGHTEAEYAEAELWLKTDENVYAQGPTHRKPQRIVDLIRHPDAPGPAGPFYPICVKPADVSRYLKAIDFAVPVPSAPPQAWPDEWHEPPAVEVLDADVRLLKVKQPWADVLVKGIKDVENRTWELKPKTGYPAWVLVVSSKSRPSGAMMADLRTRLTRVGHTLALALGTNEDEYVYGHILGMIKIETCTTNPPASVWHNASDVGWVVSDAWEFCNSIPLDENDGMQTQAALAVRPQYRAHIAKEIEKLEAAWR